MCPYRFSTSQQSTAHLTIQRLHNLATVIGDNRALLWQNANDHIWKIQGQARDAKTHVSCHIVHLYFNNISANIGTD